MTRQSRDTLSQFMLSQWASSLRDNNKFLFIDIVFDVTNREKLDQIYHNYLYWCNEANTFIFGDAVSDNKTPITC